MVGDQDAVPISVSEAYHLLAPLKARYKNTRSTSYQIYMKTVEYAEKFCKIEDKSALMDLKLFFTELGLSDAESAVLTTLLPQSSGEVKAYVPELARLDSSEMSRITEKIQNVLR